MVSDPMFPRVSADDPQSGSLFATVAAEDSRLLLLSVVPSPSHQRAPAAPAGGTMKSCTPPNTTLAVVVPLVFILAYILAQ